MKIIVVEVTPGLPPPTREIPVRLRYLPIGAAKKGKAVSGGNSGSSKKYLHPPAGIRKIPKGKTRYT